MYSQPPSSNLHCVATLFYKLTGTRYGDVTYHVYSILHDDWRWSTPIVKIEEQNGGYSIITHSGSIYTAHKKSISGEDLSDLRKEALKEWFRAKTMEKVSVEEVLESLKLDLSKTGSYTLKEYENRRK